MIRQIPLEEQARRLAKTAMRLKLGIIVVLAMAATMTLCAFARQETQPTLLRAMRVEIVDRDGKAILVLGVNKEKVGLFVYDASGKVVAEVIDVLGTGAVRVAAQKGGFATLNGGEGHGGSLAFHTADHFAAVLGCDKNNNGFLTLHRGATGERVVGLGTDGQGSGRLVISNSAGKTRIDACVTKESTGSILVYDQDDQAREVQLGERLTNK